MRKALPVCRSQFLSAIVRKRLEQRLRSGEKIVDFTIVLLSLYVTLILLPFAVI